MVGINTPSYRQDTHSHTYSIGERVCRKQWAKFVSVPDLDDRGKPRDLTRATAGRARGGDSARELTDGKSNSNNCSQAITPSKSGRTKVRLQ